MCIRDRCSSGQLILPDTFHYKVYHLSCSPGDVLKAAYTYCCYKVVTYQALCTLHCSHDVCGSLSRRIRFVSDLPGSTFILQITYGLSRKKKYSSIILFHRWNYSIFSFFFYFFVATVVTASILHTDLSYFCNVRWM